MDFQLIEPTATERKFIAAYFEAVDFTENLGGDRVMHPDFVRESVIDCLAFWQRVGCYIATDNVDQAGHDFWFTRNGHGVGFWDRPEIYGEHYAEMLTTRAHEFGEADTVWNDHPIRASIVAKPFAWPGGYERFAVTDDGGVLCFKCCEAESDCIDSAIPGDGWFIEGEGNTAESDGPIHCDHCNREILEGEQ